MKILVTGSNGLLGQKLVELISSRPDHHLIATAKTKLIPALPRGAFHLLDITNPAQVDEIIGKTKPDVVINTAAMTQVDQCETEREKCWKANVEAVQYLVEACQTNHVHLVHVSTDFIFDGSHGPLDEHEKPNPLSYYGESKLAAELVIQKSVLDWAILRTVLVYGVTQDMARSNIVLWVKKSLEDGKTINVVNDQWRTPTYIEDLVKGILLLINKKAAGIFNIAGKESLTPYDMALATAAHFKLDGSLVEKVSHETFSQPAQRPLKTGFVITKAIADLGYEPISFAEALQNF